MGLPILDALNIGGKLIDHFFPDPAKKAEAQAKLLEMAQSGDLAVIAGQVEINKIEAASPNMFVAGWRPAVGWICAAGLAYQFILRPLMTFGAALFGHPVVAPDLDMGTLMVLLTGMLGFGGLRTFEKVNDAAGNH